MYALKSVVNHQGYHPQAGHYTDEIYEKDNNMFDDDVISTYDELNSYRSKLSYILAVILQMSNVYDAANQILTNLHII